MQTNKKLDRVYWKPANGQWNMHLLYSDESAHDVAIHLRSMGYIALPCGHNMGYRTLDSVGKYAPTSKPWWAPQQTQK